MGGSFTPYPPSKCRKIHGFPTQFSPSVSDGERTGRD